MKFEYRNYNKLIKEIRNFNFLDLDLKLLTEELNRNRKLKNYETWIDVRDGIHATDGVLPEGQTTTFPKGYDWQLIKFFEDRPDFYLDTTLKTIFEEFNRKIRTIKGVDYIHIHSMTNFSIPEHVDGNLVLLIHLECPQNYEPKLFGLKVDNKLFQPKTGDLFWLETNLSHSAWNFTHSEWRFLAVSIDRYYLN